MQCISIVWFVAVYFNSLCFAILYKYALSFSRVLFVQTRTTKSVPKKEYSSINTNEYAFGDQDQDQDQEDKDNYKTIGTVNEIGRAGYGFEKSSSG